MTFGGELRRGVGEKLEVLRRAGDVQRSGQGEGLAGVDGLSPSKAIELDPGYGLPHSLLAILLSDDWQFGLARSPEMLDRAFSLAKRGAELAEFEKTGYIRWVSDLAKIPQEHGVNNVYGEIGTAFIVTFIRVRSQIASNHLGLHVQIGDGQVAERIQRYAAATAPAPIGRI